jgi:hypothetical protein
MLYSPKQTLCDSSGSPQPRDVAHHVTYTYMHMRAMERHNSARCAYVHTCGTPIVSLQPQNKCTMERHSKFVHIPLNFTYGTNAHSS